MLQAAEARITVVRSQGLDDSLSVTHSQPESYRGHDLIQTVQDSGLNLLNGLQVVNQCLDVTGPVCV